MPTVYKILGQAVQNTTTMNFVYTVPAGNSAVISTISVCNTSNTTNGRYRIAVTKSGQNFTDNSLIVSEATVLSADTAFLTLGITLSANDSIRASSLTAPNGNVTINIFGSEIF